MNKDQITLKQLLVSVQEKKLPIEKLEEYRDNMASISASMEIEWAELEKLQAVYFSENSNEKTSDVSIKRKWQVTQEGQRQIELKGYIRATDKLLSSLKARIYALIKY